MKIHPWFRFLMILGLLLLTAGCEKLQPPVSVAQRESLVGQGQVLEITNTSEDFLHEVRVQITSPSGEKREFFASSMAPNESVNVGWLKLEGWPIPKGSTVMVQAKGYPMRSGPWS